VDTYRGVVQYDLGDVIAQYNDQCNLYPSFDAWKALDPDSPESIYLNHTTGMLGIPGNIAFCSLLHAIHTFCVLGDSAFKVVGDDAIAWAQSGSLPTVIDSLQSIGLLSQEKVEVWRYYEEMDESFVHIWHYMKRPLEILLSRPYVGSMANFPPLALLFRWSDNSHTVPPMGFNRASCKKIANVLLSFVADLSSVDMQEKDIVLADRFVKLIVRRSLLAFEHLWQGTGPRLIYPSRFTHRNYTHDLVEDYWNVVVSVPETRLPSFPEEIVLLEPFRYYWTQPMKIARDMGWVDVEQVRRSFVVRDDEDAFLLFLSKSYRAVYDITVLESCPVWMRQLLSRSILDTTLSVQILSVDDFDLSDSDSDGV